MCFPYKWCQGTPVMHSSYPGTDNPLHCMVTAMAEVFRVHLSIISIGVNRKGSLQISCKCFAFVDLLFMLPRHQPLSTYSAVQRQLFDVEVHSCNLCSCTHVHAMTTTCIDYSQDTLGSFRVTENSATEVVHHFIFWHAFDLRKD